MSIAMLLSGQPRFTGDFDQLLKNLKGYDSADWFITITNNNHDRNKFKEHKGIDILDSWTEFDLNWAKDKISKNLPANNTVCKIEFSDGHLHNWPEVNNFHELRSDWSNIIFMMYYNVYRANQLRLDYEKETGTVYDAIVRIRSDIGISEELDLASLNISPNTVYMSNNEWHGLGAYRCNDQMAVGDSNSMNIYCDLVNCMKQYNERGVVFHPETLLGFHLTENHVKMEHGGYNVGLRKLPIDISRWN
jgi:hypothetical protein